MKNKLLFVVMLMVLLGTCRNPFFPAKELNDNNDVRFDIEIDDSPSHTIAVHVIDSGDGDLLAVDIASGKVGDSITLNYTVADTAFHNFLDFGGVSVPISPVHSAGSGTRTYTIDSTDAPDGNNIIIIATFEHTDLTPDPITFSDTTTHLVKTYGDEEFTNAITDTYRGSGVLRYFSEDEKVAAVDNDGTVTIRKAGTTVITAYKAADEDYAEAPRSYVLTVKPKMLTISGLTAADKVYDGTTNVMVSGTAALSGIVGEDEVSVIGGTLAFEDKNAGTNKSLVLGGWSLGGANASNYTLSTQSTTTANITPYRLTGNINASRAWLSPISGDNTTVITVNVNLPIAEDGIVNTTITITPPSPLPSGLGYNAETRTFSYNGETAFTNPNAGSFSVVLGTDNGNYSNGTQTFTISVYDGQANYTSTGFDRRIPIRQANIMAFNAYARTINGLRRHYKLTQNITLTGTDNWTAIGSYGYQFTGSFDGQFNTITGVNINRPTEDYQGFFGYVFGNAVLIRNLGLAGGSITGRNYVGGLVGENRGTVRNCTGAATVNATDYSGCAGGVVGENRGTVQICTATSAVSGNYVGGVVGENYGMVQDCYATGAVNSFLGEFANWFNVAGGVVGDNYGTVQNCYAAGNASGFLVGGVVGINCGTIANCYATGAVSSGGGGSAGGVMGRNGYDKDGINTGGTVRNCYTTGTVSGGGSAGGVTGALGSGMVQNCVVLNPSVRTTSSWLRGRVVDYNEGTLSYNYARNSMTVQYNWNGTTGTNKTITAGLNTVDGANMTTTDAVTASWWTAAGRWSTANGGTAWDFTNVWNPPSGNTLPTLRNMPAGTQNPVIQY